MIAKHIRSEPKQRKRASPKKKPVTKTVKVEPTLLDQVKEAKADPERLVQKPKADWDTIKAQAQKVKPKLRHPKTGHLRKLHTHLRKDTKRELVQYVKDNPNVSYTDIGKLYDVSCSSVSRHALAAGIRSKN